MDKSLDRFRGGGYSRTTPDINKSSLCDGDNGDSIALIASEDVEVLAIVSDVQSNVPCIAPTKYKNVTKASRSNRYVAPEVRPGPRPEGLGGELDPGTMRHDADKEPAPRNIIAHIPCLPDFLGPFQDDRVAGLAHDFADPVQEESLLDQRVR